MRLAVFVSGGGSNFQAIVDAVRDGSLPATLAVCVSSRPDAGAVERARRQAIRTEILSAPPGDEQATAREIRSIVERYEVDFIALAGFMRRVPAAVVEAFRGRMLNIHPALLPAFGGAGMYGRRVHEAAIEHGVRFSGATVHLVDEGYDTGPIVLQDVVPVLPDDTPERLAARVLEVEHRLYPDALRLFAEGRVRIDGRRVTILDPPDSTI